VRFEVAASSRVGVERAVTRLVSTGGAALQGPSAIELGSLAPGRIATSVFALSVPASGNRFYVQFQVSGLGPQGTLTRGACYNMLPDGPLQAARLVVTPSGQRVTEVAARRID